jgi:hypothetical protein
MWRLFSESCALVYVGKNAPEKLENKAGAINYEFRKNYKL